MDAAGAMLQQMAENDAESEENGPVQTQTMTPQEGSHQLGIQQGLNPTFKLQEARKTRELRWKETVKEIEKMVNSKTSGVVASTPKLPHLMQKSVTSINILKRGSFLIMRSSTLRYYIGEVLDIYKKSSSSRYGSILSSLTLEGLSWLSLRVYLPLSVVHYHHFTSGII